MKTQDAKQKKRQTDRTRNETSVSEGVIWEMAPTPESSEELVAALRGYFLTHTFDPLTGEIHTVH